MYYACLNIWILSYHKESFPAFHDDSLGLFKKMITVIETHSREKIDRVAFGTFAVSFPPHFPHLNLPHRTWLMPVPSVKRSWSTKTSLKTWISPKRSTSKTSIWMTTWLKSKRSLRSNSCFSPPTKNTARSWKKANWNGVYSTRISSGRTMWENSKLMISENWLICWTVRMRIRLLWPAMIWGNMRD